MKPIFPLLSLVRVVAALLIFFHHIYFYESGSYPYPHAVGVERIFAEGHMGVSILFVLSGFLIAARYSRDEDLFPLSAFYRRRLQRILPAYAVVFLASLAFAVRPWSEGVLYSGLLLHSLIPAAGFYLVPIGWAVSAELVFYALFPGLFRLLQWMEQRNHLRGFIPALALGLLVEFALKWLVGRLDQAFNSTEHPMYYWRYHTFWGNFFAFYSGMLAARNMPGRAPSWVMVILWTAVVVGCGEVLFRMGGYTASHVRPVDYVLIVASALLIRELALVRRDSARMRLLVEAGQGSYEFLLLHTSLFMGVCFQHMIQMEFPWSRSVYFALCLVAAFLLRFLQRRMGSNPVAESSKDGIRRF